MRRSVIFLLISLVFLGCSNTKSNNTPTPSPAPMEATIKDNDLIMSLKVSDGMSVVTQDTTLYVKLEAGTDQCLKVEPLLASDNDLLSCIGREIQTSGDWRFVTDSNNNTYYSKKYGDYIIIGVSPALYTEKSLSVLDGLVLSQ